MEFWLRLIACRYRATPAAAQEPVCRFRRVFLNARNYVTELMDNATLAVVAKGEPVTGQEVFAPGFVGGEGI